MLIRNDNQDRAPGGGKLLGTCAGLEAMTGLNANIWRVGVIAAMLIVSWKLTVLLYCVGALAFRLGRR